MREVPKPRETERRNKSPEQNLGGTGQVPKGLCFFLLGLLEVFVCLVGVLDVWVTCPFPEYMGMVYWCVLF